MEVAYRSVILKDSLMSEPGLYADVRSFITNQWGDFGDRFYSHHAPTMRHLAIATAGDLIIGISAGGSKRLAGRDVAYIEFTIVHSEYRNKGVSSHLHSLIFRTLVVPMILRRPLRGVDVVTVTPNLLVLLQLASYASWMYPKFDSAQAGEGVQVGADDETWQMAQEWLSSSDNPNRVIDREGCIIHGSYDFDPNLISVFSGDQTKWTSSRTINQFGAHYLKAPNNPGLEAFARARLNIWSIIRYLCHWPRRLY